jgi:polar amino acid transport system permease protein
MTEKIGAPVVWQAEKAPDVRGPTAPFPATVLGIGAASLAAVILGTLAVEVGFALAGGGRLSPGCIADGLKLSIKGSLGVCHIIEAVQSVWEMVFLALGLGLGLVATVLGFWKFREMDTKRRREHALTGAILGIQAVVLGAVVFWFSQGDPTQFAQQFLNFDRLGGYLGPAAPSFLTGAKNTILLAFIGEAGGIVLGLVLAMLVLSARRSVRAPARVYVNFFRGTPLIWQLSFLYFGITLGLGLHIAALKVAMVVFALNTGAYAAEVFRAGIQSIERGQMEAARSLGMSYLQAMRYAIVPQAVRRVIPPLLNEFVILIKDTSLILVLGLLASEQDLFSVARTGFSDSFNATFYVAAAIGYLIVTLPLIGLVNAVERRLRSGLVGIGAGQQGL